MDGSYRVPFLSLKDAVVTMDSCIWPKLLYLVSHDGAFFKIMLSKMLLVSSLRYVTSDLVTKSRSLGRGDLGTTGLVTSSTVAKKTIIS